MTGYRVLPHAADTILEAWAPDRVGCLAAAVNGMVGAFADPGDTRPDRRVPVEVVAGTDEDLLVRLLEAVIFVIDTEGRVPVDVTLEETATGVRGWFDTVSVDRVEEIGAVPKGVSRSHAALGRDRAGWRGRVTIDV